MRNFAIPIDSMRSESVITHENERCANNIFVKIKSIAIKFAGEYASRGFIADYRAQRRYPLFDTRIARVDFQEIAVYRGPE